MNRPDLFALVGHRVTITRPGHTDPVTGRLAAYAESPHLILDLDDGQRWILPQYRCKVVPAESAPEMTDRPEVPDESFRVERCQNETITGLRARIDPGTRELADQRLAATRNAASVLAPMFDQPSETGLLAALRDMTANLQAHIDQRASELAAPRIEEADERVAAAEERCRELRDASWSARREHDRRTELLRQRAEAAEGTIVKTHDHFTRNLTGLVGKSGYEAGYRDCANEITRILNHQQEADRG